MEEALRFIRSQPKRVFKKGEILVYQGDEPATLFGIMEGFVKMHDVSKDGTEQFIWLAKRHDVLPLGWLFSQSKKSPFFYTAFTDVTTYLIDKCQFLEIIRNNNEALLGIVEAITAKYSHIAQHLSAAQKPRAREKVMHLLHFIAIRFSSEQTEGIERVEVPLTHQDIASLLGLTRETATLALGRLKKEGFIHYDKNHFYIYSKKLAESII